MKKVHLVTLDYEKEKSLIKLRKAGVVHLEKSFGTSENLDRLEVSRAEVGQILSYLDADKKIEPKELKGYEIISLKNKILELGRKKAELEDNRDSLVKEISRIGIWGEFDPADIEILRSKGIDIRLYRLSRDEYKALSSDFESFTVKETKSVILVAIVSLDGEFPENLEEFALPQFGIIELKDNLRENGEVYQSVLKELKDLSSYRHIVEEDLDRLNHEIEFEQFKTGMGVDDSLVYLTGYIPVDREGELKELAAAEQWALSLSEPAEDDPVPTQVKNSKVVSFIQPVFDMLGTIPGYQEYDISSWFLLFFSIFYAMIIGDAGYGLVFMGLAVMLNLKMKKINPIVGLLYLISSTTIIWGIITGTWFGSEALASWGPLKSMTIPQIASFPQVFGRADITEDTTQYLIKMICFIMGTVHISIAHLKNFFKQLPSLSAITQLAWLSMVLGLYFLVMQLVLGVEELPDFAFYMIIGGLIGVFVFSEQKKGVNFFVGIAKGLAGAITTFLDSIGAFSDIISYIRLFAVGLASVAISVSFNQMAAPLMEGPAIIGGVLILLAGHTLNLAMGLLSVVVHGVRLNMLEFSGHLGMEWTGIKYEPFKARD
ncbi:MAG: V-type ATP synthase subunit I [Spirochaetales bacterium]|nr:V-type ATP synthase subunit I [Spirochaetales bacterium]